MKKSMLLQMYLNENFGDDMFLDLIAKRFPKVEFELIGNIPQVYVNKYHNVKVYRLNPLRAKLDKLFRYVFHKNIYLDLRQSKNHGVVILGGSVFMDKPLAKRIYKTRMNSIKCGKPFFVIGANFGPAFSQLFVDNYHEFFARCHDVCFRDSISADCFADIESVRYQPDVVFNMVKRDEEILRGQVGISIIDLEDGSHKTIGNLKSSYEKKMVELIDDILRGGYCVRLYSFCNKQGDLRAINRIMGRLSNPNHVNLSSYYYHDLKLNEFDIDFARNEYIIATRFHSMILGIKNGQKVFPIIYDDKTRSVIKDLNIKNYCDLKTIDSVTVSQVLEANVVKGIERLSKEAQLQFKGLDKYIS